ncbi:MAG: multiheme c-type cytochrome [Bacillota bacterium]|uniref:Cytochrome c-552/4 domain-containing protein n=1 Tax=Thermanaerosceptrum fracticalcis TaxID=1712410 RepID=A0A7G6DYM9_THEFR|nr:multiheme c-type cytochrome [Thermanaerosceptrum fracticalcis]QNB44933.1 hypothetical protein BR63_00470 [Thermanaerosceptrum fracticalcis]
MDTKHGNLDCRTCHGGQNSADMTLAHKDLVKDPSDTVGGGVCAECHQEIADTFKDSLHFKQTGFVKSLEEFSHEGILNEDGALKEAFAGNCSTCHVSCGDCHVSRPKAQSGGLLAQHQFVMPDMEKNCVLCHSTRNGAEYTGTVGITADVHYQKGLTCIDCHPATNFHGSKPEATEMMLKEDLPDCLDCHKDTYGPESKIEAHKAHPENTLSCQVCHSSATNNCFECHINVKEDGKLASHSEVKLMFKIGKNPAPDKLHPEKYITVRHIPTIKNSFDALGKNALPNFDEIPNWKLSPTHNIQRFTPQNSDCETCHSTKGLYLTKEDLRPSDSKANEKLLVDK